MKTASRRVHSITAVGLLLLCRSALADFTFEFDGHSYLLVEENRSWLDAALDASSRQLGASSGNLAIIESAAENQAIFDQLVANISVAEFNNTRAPDGGNGAYVWIAATDLVTEGTWIWDGDGDGVGQHFWQGTGNSGTGSVIDGLYNNWGHDPRNSSMQWEPDNGRGTQNAGGIGLSDWPRGFASEWNDVQADNTLYYLVEFDTIGLTCDLDASGTCDIVDIDLLMNAIAAETDDSAFDLNDDGRVNDADRDVWLADAGPANGFAGPFLVGDSNLNGTVAVEDLNALGLTWTSDNSNWSNGNFTGAGSNAGDLNALALNWQDSVPAAALAVPEPGFLTFVPAFIALGFGWFGSRNKSIHRSVRGNAEKELANGGREASLFYTSLCWRFRRACPGGSDNWRATPGRYGTPSRSIHGSPSGLSRREHDLRARCVPAQSWLPPGQARRRARYLASLGSQPVVIPPGQARRKSHRLV